MKVLIACLATESNTFAPLPAGWSAWKAGQYTRTATQEPAHLFSEPLYEWRRLAEARGWEVVESRSAFAEPAGITTRHVYETMRDEILADLEAALPDIFLISMHGAMVADGYDDCEGDMMARARGILGPERVIGLELDPHNHMTAAMLENADLIVNYKEYPHIDAPDRARELFVMAADTAEGKIRPVMRTYDCRMMVMMRTLQEPAKSFVQEMKDREGKDGVLSLSLTHSFPFSDVADVGMKMLAITNGDPDLAEVEANAFGDRLWNLRHELLQPLPDISAALDAVDATTERPYVLADMADNAGAGAPSDSSFFLRAVLDRGMKDIALGMYWDPVLVNLCRDAGLGARLRVRVGGKVSRESGDPVDLDVIVRGMKENMAQKLGDSEWAIGDAVWLEADGIHLVVNSIRTQCFNPTLFTDLGIDITKMRALIIKSMNHFYAAFEPVAEKVIHVATPGVANMDVTRLPLTKRNLNYFPRVDDPFSAA
ncbi:M81 family metallopeptidase [Ruegeria marina]|uniref:Microcystinase C n=1 Tax=Ruegeria marina TaxID=639004 RepID=A0A1G7FFZ3_9RHOB|nr:M81 family metallopeptidase [Ruegeria marina]SDE74816.1 Microcystin degradation protein MlrC, contains DUF1485 domain [Ruegeria marina]